jgi:hypothetical protein
MNGSSHHENRIITIVPRLRASSRHGRARQFLEFFRHLNRRGGVPSGAAEFIAMVNDEHSLIYLNIMNYMINPGEKQAVAPGGSLHSVLLAPAARASPNSAIIIKRLMEKSDKSGRMGMPPRMLPPPLGERGGHPRSCRREYVNYRKKRFLIKL